MKKRKDSKQKKKLDESPKKLLKDNFKLKSIQISY